MSERVTRAVRNSDTAYGSLTTFNTSKYTGTGGEAGVSSGFAFSVALWFPTRAVGAAFRAIAGRFGAGPNTGYLLGSNGAIDDLRVLIIDGAATAQTATFNLSAANVGKVILATGIHDGSNVKIAINGVVQTTTPITGYSATSVATQIGGRSSDSQAPSDIYVMGMSTGVGQITAVELSRHFALCKKACRVLPISGGGMRPTHCWNVSSQKKVPVMFDEVGTDHLTLTEAGGAVTWATLQDASF